MKDLLGGLQVECAAHAPVRGEDLEDGGAFDLFGLPAALLEEGALPCVLRGDTAHVKAG